MDETAILEGKKLLIVDDEPDVVEVITELLKKCIIDTASDFETGAKLLNENEYDMVVLDIMGVNGYDLLEIANKKAIPALMLTANALTPDNFAKSITKGAKAYIPKEKMAEIGIYLSDLLKAQEGTEKHDRWFSRLESYFQMIFGRDWINEYRELRQEIEKRSGMKLDRFDLD